MELCHGCEANLVGTRSPRRARTSRPIEVSGGEAELFAALSEACEGMGLRQKWNWQPKFGRRAEETNETKQSILCCDSSATHGAMKRQDSRLAERDASSCKRSFCNNGPRDLVQMGTSEILADCLTNMQSTPNSIHLSRLGLGIKSFPEQI